MTLPEEQLPRSLVFALRKSFCKHFLWVRFYSQTWMGKNLKRKFHINATTNKLIFITCSFLTVQVCRTSLSYKIEKRWLSIFLNYLRYGGVRRWSGKKNLMPPGGKMWNFMTAAKLKDLLNLQAL